MNSYDAADCALVKTSVTEFKVLNSVTDVELIEEFLDRFMGPHTFVEYPADCSIFIFSLGPDGCVFSTDYECAKILFERDGHEARVYEFDKWDYQLRARGQIYMQRRLKK